MKSWLQGDVPKIPIGRRTATAIGSATVVLCGSAFKSGGWEGLSHLLTLTYQVGWALLLCHHFLHLYERYFSIGLARATWVEFALLVAWTCGVGVLDLLPDPKLSVLAGIWLLSAGFLFWSATQVEIDREALKEKTGYRAPRATDVIRGSFIWVELDSRLAQVKDDTVDAFREKLNGRDTEDGNLSHTSWALWCSTFAVSLIAVAGALGSTVMPEHPHEGKGGNGNHENTHHTKIGSEDCSSRYLPVGVPEPQREALALAWHEVHGLEPGLMEALGFDVAGCPGPARPIPGLPDSWYAPSYCEGNLRGIALAFDGLDHPVFLLEQAAEFALPMIRDRQLVSAEDRFEVGGDGDAYVIDSREGSFVLVRDDASAGPVREGDGKTGCGEYTDRDVAYTVVGPGLLGPWQAVAAVTPGGVYPIADGAVSEGKVRFALRSTEDGIVATVRCLVSLLSCETKIGGTLHRWSGKARTDRAGVEALVEP
ncbi:MAG TPA: hypothetical protein VFK14_13115 [Solirubrobacterales bacterium]|nr:hypothetical protein [Solirubrobacterales bacterium]